MTLPFDAYDYACERALNLGVAITDEAMELVLATIEHMRDADVVSKMGAVDAIIHTETGAPVQLMQDMED